MNKIILDFTENWKEETSSGKGNDHEKIEKNYSRSPKFESFEINV